MSNPSPKRLHPGIIFNFVDVKKLVEISNIVDGYSDGKYAILSTLLSDEMIEAATKAITEELAPEDVAVDELPKGGDEVISLATGKQSIFPIILPGTMIEVAPNVWDLQLLTKYDLSTGMGVSMDLPGFTRDHGISTLWAMRSNSFMSDQQLQEVAHLRYKVGHVLVSES